MDAKTLKQVIKTLSVRRSNLYAVERNCCSWERPQIEGMLDENKQVSEYLTRALKRAESVAKKKQGNK